MRWRASLDQFVLRGPGRQSREIVGHAEQIETESDQASNKFTDAFMDSRNIVTVQRLNEVAWCVLIVLRKTGT